MTYVEEIKFIERQIALQKAEAERPRGWGSWVSNVTIKDVEDVLAKVIVMRDNYERHLTREIFDYSWGE